MPLWDKLIAGTGAGKPPSDPLFGHTPLLLHMDGANGGTTFTDSSAQGLTATVTGNAATSTAQSRFGTASLLSSTTQATNSCVGFSNVGTGLIFAGDFTVEWWTYWNSSWSAAFQGLWDEGYGGVGYLAETRTSGSNLLSLLANGGILGAESSAAASSVWHHYVCVRKGSTVDYIRDGVVTFSVTSSVTTSSSTNFTIGGFASNLTTGLDPFIGGYIDEFRVVNGFWRYWDPSLYFIPPTTTFPVTYGAASTNDPFWNAQTPGTVELLAQFSANINDASVNGLTGTAGGSAATGAATVTPPTGQSNVLVLNGTSQYVTFPATAGFVIGSAVDFTIEFDLYATNLGANKYIYSEGTTSFAYVDGNQNIVWADGAGTTILTSVGTPTLQNGRWYHVALQRSNGTASIWVNGFQNTSGANATAILANHILCIGAFNGGASNFIGGNIAAFRITTGIARYPGTVFAQGTAGLLPTTLANDNLQPIVALHPTFITNLTDAGPNNITPTAFGSAAVGALSTTAPNGQTKGISFNGTTQYVSYAANSAFVVGTTTDVTVEFWIKPPAGFGNTHVFTQGINSSFEFGPQMALWFDASAIGFGVNGTGPTYAGNIWHHIVLVRLGTTIQIWVDGALIKSGTNSTARYANANIDIGTYNAGAIFYQFELSDFRITNGAARYPSFTIPTAAGPTKWVDPYWNYVNLLANFQNNNTDSSQQAQTITINGTMPYTAASGPFSGTYSIGNTSDNSTANYVSVANTAINDPSKGQDWTLEGWVKIAANPAGTRQIISWGVNPNVYALALLGVNSTGHLIVYSALTAATGYVTGMGGDPYTIITGGAWHHLVLQRIGSTTYLYIDGVLAVSGSNGGGAYSGNAAGAYYGLGYAGTGVVGNSPVASWYGWRFTNGVGRYPTAFTPPLQPYPTSSS